MPRKPLLQKLVARLKLAVKKSNKRGKKLSRAHTALGKMSVLDYRKNSFVQVPKTNIKHWGLRVRQMNVSRTFPGTELVIKKVHDATARKTISVILSKVKKHNKKFRPRHYKLVSPKAYAIGKGLVAMSKINAPELDEVLNSKTSKGRAMFREIKNELGLKRSELNFIGEEFWNRTGIKPSNILILGIEGKRMVFMPLIDII